MLQTSKDPLLEAGAVVANRYELERVVGEGGMGVVWAASDRKTGNRVALKFLREDRASDVRHQERLLREAKAAAAVRHPNVATVHEVLETATGRPFLVMDLLQGEPLAARLARDGTLPLPECARVLGAVVDAIQAAHGSGIIHRDLKPENIFLLGAGTSPPSVRVLDFGIAKTVEREDTTHAPSLTTTGTMLGTPYYMAPEQIFGDNDVDGKADVWALGVVLYECLSGKRPTQATGVGQVLKVIMNDAIPPLSEVAPDVPTDVAALVSKMLSRRRDDRPDLTQVRAVLADAASRPSRPSIPTPSRRPSGPTLDSMAIAPISSRTPPASSRQTVASAVATPPALAREVAETRPVRRPRLLAAVAVGAGAFAVVGVLTVMSGAGEGGTLAGEGRGSTEGARTIRSGSAASAALTLAGEPSTTRRVVARPPAGQVSVAPVVATSASRTGSRPTPVTTAAPSGTIPSGERR
jgi:eukaryotic-like serine/threonine-protein kinase